MRHSILVTLFFLSTSTTCLSQWTFTEFNDPFDGIVKATSVIGKSQSSEYPSPQLVVNTFNDETLNFYLSRSGYSGCSNNFLLLKFDNDQTLYKTRLVGSNAENDIFFIHSFDGNVTLLSILEKLKQHSILNIRVSSSCIDKRDFQFSLTGSSQAINKVISGYIEKINSTIRQNELNDKWIQYVESFNDSVITNLVSNTAKLRKTWKDSSFVDVLGYDVINDKFEVVSENTNSWIEASSLQSITSSATVQHLQRYYTKALKDSASLFNQNSIELIHLTKSVELYQKDLKRKIIILGLENYSRNQTKEHIVLQVQGEQNRTVSYWLNFLDEELLEIAVSFYVDLINNEEVKLRKLNNSKVSSLNSNQEFEQIELIIHENNLNFYKKFGQELRPRSYDNPQQGDTVVVTKKIQHNDSLYLELTKVNDNRTILIKPNDLGLDSLNQIKLLQLIKN